MLFSKNRILRNCLICTSFLSLTLFVGSESSNSNFEMNYRNKKDAYNTNNIKEDKEYYLGLERYDFIVGVHAYYMIDSYQHLSWTNPNSLVTPFMRKNALRTCEFSLTTTSTTQTSISFTETIKTEYAKSIAVNVGIKMVDIESKSELTNSYTFSTTQTYTNSKTVTSQIIFPLNFDSIRSDISFGIGFIGDVYKLRIKKYTAHDFWWNHKQYGNNYEFFDAYIVDSPTLTIVYSDGSFLL